MLRVFRGLSPGLPSGSCRAQLRLKLPAFRCDIPGVEDGRHDTDALRARRQHGVECVQIDAADRKQSTHAKFFWGQQLNCTIHNCQWQTKKVPSDEYGQLTVFLAPDVGNKTLVEEYELYKKVIKHFSK